jgi:subtilisin family serine protease
MNESLRLFVLLTVLCPMLRAQTPSLSPKFQPSGVVATLATESDARLDFIVRGAPTGIDAARTSMREADGKAQPLPFIGGVGITVTLKTAVRLASRADITQIWYIPHSLYPTYTRIIDGLEYTTKTLHPPSLINMSLGPPADVMPMIAHDDEPMNVATKKVTDQGFIIVMAIGNYGDGDNGDNNGIVNPWCHPAWIICVGAASPDAKKVWYGSARGLDSDPTTWPTVVADGVDVIGPWPTGMTKPDDREKYDEADTSFRENVPKEKWPLYTLDSGTSEATPQVTRAAAQILAFLQNIIASKKNVHAEDYLFEMDVPRERLATTSRSGARLTGEVKDTGDPKQVGIVYRLVEPWKLVKQLLIDSAVPMPGFAAATVGAGFVDPNYVAQQFPTPEKLNVQIESVKVQ